MFNSFGNIFRLTSFGESHGKGIGGVIDFRQELSSTKNLYNKNLIVAVRDNPFLPLHVKKLIKLSFFQVFLKGNPPDALLVLSFGMKTNTPMTTTI